MTFALLAAAVLAAADPPPAPPDPPASFTIAIAGDLLLARGVARRAEAEGWEAVMAPLRDTLAEADASLVNLESPLGACLSDGNQARPRLCGPPAAAARPATRRQARGMREARGIGRSLSVEGCRSAGIIGRGVTVTR